MKEETTASQVLPLTGSMLEFDQLVAIDDEEEPSPVLS